MNPIEYKQQQFHTLCRQYGLMPEKIEVNRKTRELVFEFLTNRDKNCDQITVQQALTGIFDFAGSLSVIMTSKPTFTAKPAEVTEAQESVVPKKSEPVQKSVVSKQAQPVQKSASKLAETAVQYGKKNKGGKIKKPVGNAFYGKPITEVPQSLSEIDFSKGQELDGRHFCAEGRVFGIDSRACRNDGEIFTFNLTDERGSIGVKLFDKACNLTTLHDKLKKNSWVKVEGKLSNDAYLDRKSVV